MAYTNSSLVTYKNLTSDRTAPRKHKIDTITIHCFVGQVTAKRGCDYFVETDRQVSSNYVVGHDGSIGLSVEEKNRAWTSGGRDRNGNVIRVNGISGADNDHRAVTIEVASDTKPPYAITDKAMKALIELVADICKRNGIKKLMWKGDKSLVGKVDKQNMTVHKWFANTSCPGDYLYGKHSYIAEQVNKKLGASTSTTTTPTSSATTTKKELYRVRKTWKDSTTQIGAYSSLENAKKVCKSGYSVFDSKGNVVYPEKAVEKDDFFPARGYFKQGDKGDNVAKINLFYRKVFPSYATTLKRNKENLRGSSFNADTVAWTKEFQKRTGLEADGFIGKLTVAEMEKFGFKK